MKFFILFFFVFTKAYGGSLNLVGINFSESKRYSFLDDSLKEKFPANYLLYTNYGYVKSPFFYQNDDGFSGDIISYNHVVNIGGAKYLREDLLLGLQTSLVNNKVFDKSYSSLADSSLKLNWNFYKEIINLSVLTKIFLPSGVKENFSTRNSPGAALSLVGEKSYERFHFLLSLGYSYANNQIYQEIDFRELFLSQLGISFDLSEKWNINLETYRNFSFKGQHSQNEGDYFLTGKFRHDLFLSSYFGAGVAGLDSVTRNNFSIFAGLKLAFDKDEPLLVRVVIPSSYHFESRDEEKILGTLLTSDHIYFKNNSTEIETKEKIKINNVIKLFAENKHRLSHIVLEGFSSKKGNLTYNHQLSEKRAHVVKNLLIENGIPQNILSIVGYGDQVDQHEDENKNRRVSFRVYLNKGTL